MSYFGYKRLMTGSHVFKDLTTMSYSDTLDAIKAIHSIMRKTEDLETYATAELQGKFPGNYHIEEYYDSEFNSFKLRMVFDSEADEIDFVLKYK